MRMRTINGSWRGAVRRGGGGPLIATGPGEYTCNYTLLLRRHGRFHRWVINRILHSRRAFPLLAPRSPRPWIRTEIISGNAAPTLPFINRCRSSHIIYHHRSLRLLHNVIGITTFALEIRKRDYREWVTKEKQLSRISNIFERYAWVFPGKKRFMYDKAGFCKCYAHEIINSMIK